MSSQGAALSVLPYFLFLCFLLRQAYNVEETLAISSQVMNRHNYRIVLEEILKAGNMKRSQLPEDLHTYTPLQQVS